MDGRENILFDAFYLHATFYPDMSVDCCGRFQPRRPCAPNCWFIGKEKLRDALLELDVHVKPEDINTLFYTLDLTNEERGVDILEFQRAFQVRIFLVVDSRICQVRTPYR